MPDSLYSDPDLSLEKIFKELLDNVLSGDVKLPSLPDVTMKVRAAIADDNSTTAEVTNLIAKDPAMTAYLVQTASSPIYRRAVPPKTLTDVVNMLGLSATNSLVMLHSARNMVEIKNSAARKIFQHTWERLVVKASVGAFLAQRLKVLPFDYVQLAMLLTEVGSLTVLSAMLDSSEDFDSSTYFLMCRHYSKKIGGAVLRKWEVDRGITEVMEKSGQWDYTQEDQIGLLDIANLTIYHTVRMTVDEPVLPELDTLAAFQKLPEAMRKSEFEEGWLDLLSENREEVDEIVRSFG